MTSKQHLLRASLAISLLMAGTGRARACQYCRLAATDPEAARMAAQMHAGGFPLDATINQFQGTVPPATLTAPPPPSEVATSAVDLPVAAARWHAPQAAILPVKKALVPVAKEAKAAPVPLRWSDAGLLGLAAAGGLFCWRTRRVAGSLS